MKANKTSVKLQRHARGPAAGAGSAPSLLAAAFASLLATAVASLLAAAFVWRERVDGGMILSEF